jgi:hypothetical protein
MMTKRHVSTNSAKITATLLATAIALSACGSSPTSQSPNTTSPPANAAADASTPASSALPAVDPNYHPVINPADFTTKVTNRYFPLTPGTTLIFDGIRDGKPMHTEMVVTKETKKIMGVDTLVIRDTVTSDGALVEKTTDWYAQASNGDVWYFGEATAEYVNGQVSNTKGSWEGGVDGAQPGIIMEASPKAGDSYRQESRPGIAEDQATVLRIDPSLTLKSGTYKDVVVTEDVNPLEPDKHDTKKYSPGVGLVYTNRVRAGHSEEAEFVKATIA